MNPVTAFLLIAAGLVVSAHARLNAILFGQPVSIQWLGVAAAVIVLILVALVLWLAREFLREFRQHRPRFVDRPVYVITSLT